MDTSVQLEIQRLLAEAVQRKASYIHLTVGAPPVLRVEEVLVELTDRAIVNQQFMEHLIDGLLQPEQRQQLNQDKELTCVLNIADKFRCKLNVFYQKGSLSGTLKLIPQQIPGLQALGLPRVATEIVKHKSGLVVVAGPYGSGRTTTIAAMVEEINKNRAATIVSIERPIEYFFLGKKSIIEQREVGRDVASFEAALVNVTEADVDVVVVGATKEPAVPQLLLEFVTAGRLAFFEMNSTSVVQAVSEILTSYPQDDRERGQLLLADGLAAIICQRLVPRREGGTALAAEILVMTESLRSLLREGRLKQLTTLIQSSRAEGMATLDQSLADLVSTGQVTLEQASEYAFDRDVLRTLIN